MIGWIDQTRSDASASHRRSRERWRRGDARRCEEQKTGGHCFLYLLPRSLTSRLNRFDRSRYPGSEREAEAEAELLDHTDLSDADQPRVLARWAAPPASQVRGDEEKVAKKPTLVATWAGGRGSRRRRRRRHARFLAHSTLRRRIPHTHTHLPPPTTKKTAGTPGRPGVNIAQNQQQYRPQGQQGLPPRAKVVLLGDRCATELSRPPLPSILPQSLAHAPSLIHTS